jgi:hypothetical protein
VSLSLFIASTQQCTEGDNKIGKQNSEEQKYMALDNEVQSSPLISPSYGLLYNINFP